MHYSSWPGAVRSEPPAPELVAQAIRNPGGCVAEIDSAFTDGVEQYVPPEAIRGVWLVDEDGRLTGEFRRNPEFGPPKDDFSKLSESGHWLGWLGEAPSAAVREGIAELLDEQVAGAVLEWVKVPDAPRYLTGGRLQPGDQSRLVVTRAGLALPFVLSVSTPDGSRDTLTGVFSWVSVNLDRPRARQDQVWLDLRADLDEAEETLRSRIYEPRPMA